ncbi:MFS transporter [Embleya scabrispora]|uniref:MFS transporter n=1 Tax=Embleya scabrispora TaxID=159449 RepID=A0A1T3P6A2_9ACTN|nr:MFS transporter [Embleya scabrispora]OPC84532.1 MFS transporter [Embleya scabrispora]
MAEDARADLAAHPTDTTDADKNARLVLILVTVASVLLVVDITMVSVGLPRIQDDLNGSLTGLQWVIVAYSLTFGAFLQTAGSVSDRIGRRPVFLAGIALFTLSSLACGLAPNILVLDGFRGLQGIGAAMLLATGLPLIAQAYRGQRRNMAIATWGSTLGACAAVAPLLGGLLVDVANWRWMFLVNVPIGILAFALAAARLPRVRPAPQAGPIDRLGAAALVLMWGLLNLTVTRGDAVGWTAPATLGGFAGVALLLAGFVVVERRAAAPMLDLTLFRIPTFVGALSISFLSRFVTVGSSVYFLLYFQGALDLSPLESGLLLLPIFVPQLSLGLVSGRLQERFAAAHVIAAGFAGLALGALLMGLVFVPDASWPALLPGLFVWGVGGGLASSPVMSIAVNTVPVERAGMASGTANGLFPIGAAVGIAVLGVPFSARFDAEFGTPAGVPDPIRAEIVAAAHNGDTDRIREATPAHAGEAVSAAIDHAYAAGASTVMYTVAALALTTAALALALVRQRDLHPADEG